MVISKRGGISIQGSYHEINQDCFMATIKNDINILVISDGLGSIEHSEIGSHATCEAVLRAVDSTDFNTCSSYEFISEIYYQWQLLVTLPPDECAATCLFCVVSDTRVLAGQLGDGYMCLLYPEDSIVLFDSKDDCFENETECLSSEYDISRWRICELPKDSLKAVIMCSDGVKLRNDSYEAILAFANDVYLEYADKSDLQTQAEITGWLSEWTGSDDKTLVYFFGGEQCQRK